MKYYDVYMLVVDAPLAANCTIIQTVAKITSTVFLPVVKKAMYGLINSKICLYPTALMYL